MVEKCTFCVHRLQKAKDKARAEGRKRIRDGDYVPACAQSCPARAISFGNLEDKDSQVYKLHRSPRAYRLFEDLGGDPLAVTALWTYFTFTEYWTVFYTHHPHEMKVFWYKISGPYAVWFWTMIACNTVIPLFLLSLKKNMAGIVTASVFIVIGMWLERLNIVVPTLANPGLPYPTGSYIISVTGVSLFIGSFAVFCLGYLVYARLFPLIAAWEVQEGREEGPENVKRQVESYLPDPVKT